MSFAAAGAAGAIARSRRRVVATFRESGATAPAHAMGFQAARPFDGRTFQRLVAGGVLKAVGEGRYYLDEAALAEANLRRRRRVLVALLLVTTATVIILWISLGAAAR